MFYEIRYQTGEIAKIIDEMKNGNIPCMDVYDDYDMDMFINRLESEGIYKIKDLPYDKNARDRIKEPEFEYRIGFYTSPLSLSQLGNKKPMFIDFYFEPEVERSYDPVGEM